MAHKVAPPPQVLRLAVAAPKKIPDTSDAMYMGSFVQQVFGR